MLKAGDHVFIDGTRERGLKKDVRPHEVVFAVRIATGTEKRRYAIESVRLDRTMARGAKGRPRILAFHDWPRCVSVLRFA